ncbi:MAG: hypothetical protein ACI90V_003753 [Bacillariaceae sp.]|jgi:hypothetical protein
MGRKKRKVVVVDDTTADDVDADPQTEGIQQQEQQKQDDNQQQQQNATSKSKSEDGTDNVNGNGDTTEAKKASSSYAMTSHSAEIIDEDMYISDGSESDEDLMTDLHQPPEVSAGNDDENDDDGEQNQQPSNLAGRSIEMVLSGSRMGLMRKGIYRPSTLVQPNRQWSRQSTTKDNKNAAGGVEEGASSNGEASPNNEDVEDPAIAEERRKREKEEELAKLDPAERAARLLAEKQKKLEEAKVLARRLESEENAGRDPGLFSKRTSFDIQFDHIEEKQWERGGDMTDYFNYGFSEEDWLEYGEQQLMIRQELLDANRQNRPPDHSIVPVIPKVSVVL